MTGSQRAGQALTAFGQVLGNQGTKMGLCPPGLEAEQRFSTWAAHWNHPGSSLNTPVLGLCPS